MKTRLNNMERNETPSFEGDERRARILTWAFAFAASLLVNAAIFAACCWKVEAAFGWMTGGAL